MLMNHRAHPFKVYVRTKITYSDTPKTEVTPLWLDTAGCDLDPTYTVPGDGPKGSNHVDDAIYTVPEDGRIIGGQGHLHGGGKYQTRHEHLVRQPAADPVAGLLRHAQPHLLPRAADPARAVAGLDEPHGLPRRASR